LRNLDTNVLLAGFTLILVIITASYAKTMKEQSITMKEQSTIAQNQKELFINEKMGKYIAEIARSIFSPMHKDLENFDAHLENGNILSSTSPLQTIFDGKRLSQYLTGAVFIPNTTFSKPVSILLNVPDDILQIKYLPKINELCQNFETILKDLNLSLELICQNKPMIWNDFKAHCLELDPNLNEQDNPDIFDHIFKCALTQFDPMANSTALSEDQLENPVIQGMVFPNRNNGEILEWLKKSQLNCAIEQYLDNKEKFQQTINELLSNIENLLLEWKIKYYLLESEMHG
jgi:hypothetical protein